MPNGILPTKADALADTPKATWHVLTESERREIVSHRLFMKPVNYPVAFDIIEARANGSVVLSLHDDEKLKAGERGDYLRFIESILKEFDPALHTYLQPKVDKNALRHFRGVTIK